MAGKTAGKVSFAQDRFMLPEPNLPGRAGGAMKSGAGREGVLDLTVRQEQANVYLKQLDGDDVVELLCARYGAEKLFNVGLLDWMAERGMVDTEWIAAPLRNVGDKVAVRSKEWMDAQEKDRFGDIYTHLRGEVLSKEMQALAGSEATIIGETERGYLIDIGEPGQVWGGWMFEPEEGL
jgi:hypothetical protein